MSKSRRPKGLPYLQISPETELDEWGLEEEDEWSIGPEIGIPF